MRIERRKTAERLITMQLITIVIYLFLSAGGLILFKLGSKLSAVSIILEKGVLGFSINVYSLAGLCCYLLSFVLYMQIVTKYDLTRIYPITSGLVYVLVFLGGIFILGENLSVVKFIGSVAILLGIILMNL